MTVTQTHATDDVLEFIDEAVRQLQQEGLEAAYVVVGPASYETLRHAIGRRYNRTPGTFETYQYLSIVLDPYRGDEVCVLPAPSALAGGVRALEV